MALERFESDMETCTRCSACKFVPLETISSYDHVNVCPSIARYDFNAYSGGGRLAFGLGLLRERVDYTPKVAEIIYSCHLCGGCDVSCKYGMDMEVLEPLYAMRRECVERGLTQPVLDKMVSSMRKHGPLLQGAGGTRGQWLKGLGVKDCREEKVKVVYHTGCLASHDQASGEVARAALSLLAKAGVDVGATPDELCCGGRAYGMGYENDALEQARLNVARLQEYGAELLVTGCAHCYEAFKVLYPKMGVASDLKVLHTTEYLAQLIGEGKLKPKTAVDLTVTYHDPCHLGRLAEPWVAWEGRQRERHMRVYDPPRPFRRGSDGVYGPPREVLRSIPGLKLVEMSRTREYAWCCGAGGGVKETNPEFAHWTAAERLQEADSSGAEALVTACPHCVRSFQEALKDGGGQLKVYDVVELLEQAT